MPESIADKVRKESGHKRKVRAITGDVLGEIDIVRMQVEGGKDSGKSTFILSMMAHLRKKMKLPKKEILVCIMDFDKRGIGRLLKKNAIPKSLQKRIIYWKCTDIMDAYDAWDYMEVKLKKHVKKYGHTAGAWIVIENTGAMWDFAQDYYAETIEGMTMRELLLKKKKEAKRKGHTAFSTFGSQRDAYKVINPLHNNLRNSITNSDFNVIFTCHMKDVYGNAESGTEGKIVGQKGEGQKKNVADMDFIIRCTIEQKSNTYLKQLRASKDTSLKFKKEKDMDFTRFWKWIYAIMKREAEKEGRARPEKYWLKPIKKTPKEEESE